MTPYLATSYVSRVCNVPPLVAQAALQEVARTAPMRSGLQWQLRLRTPKGPRVPALLVAGWGQRASVMIEIEPWSDTCDDRIAT